MGDRESDGAPSKGLRRHAAKIALPLAAALGVGAAVAVAAIPGSDGTITGCYAGANGITINGSSFSATEAPGALRVIDPSGSGGSPGGASPPPANVCQQGETQITWNQQGPTGPQGPAGPGGAGFSLQSSSGLAYLNLDGIAGGNREKKKKKDSIQIESWSFGVSNSRAAGSGGGGGGHTLTITKRVDASSPKLFAAAASGKNIKHAELILVRKKKGPPEEYLRIEMTDVLVSSIHEQSSKSTPLESVTFDFHKIEWTFLGGGGGASVKASPVLTISG